MFSDFGPPEDDLEICTACGGYGEGPDLVDGPGDVYRLPCSTCGGKGRVSKAQPSGEPEDYVTAEEADGECF